MSEPTPATLLRLSDLDETVSDPDSDIRGRHVVDANQQPLGKIDELLVDDTEHKVRFLEVASGGFLGLGESKSLIPVDAITKITSDEVHIDQTSEKVAGAPAYDPALVNESDVVHGTYRHYEKTPFWGAEYSAPSYLDSGLLGPH